MTRIESILLQVRDVLADHKKQRWSDEVLIRLLNEGLLNFILQARTLKLKAYIELENNTAVYDLSKYAISIDRVQYLEKVLGSKTEEEMDKMNISWQIKEGSEPELIVFDNQKQGVFRIYPIITQNALDNIEQNSLYGILIDINVIDDLFKLPSFGNVSYEGKKFIIVYYTGKPRILTIDSVDEDIDLDTLYDQAMISYISGQALRFDADTLNRQFGAEQLSIYKSYVEQAKVKEAEANNTFIRRDVAYKGFV